MLSLVWNVHCDDVLKFYLCSADWSSKPECMDLKTSSFRSCNILSLKSVLVEDYGCERMDRIPKCTWDLKLLIIPELENREAFVVNPFFRDISNFLQIFPHRCYLCALLQFDLNSIFLRFLISYLLITNKTKETLRSIISLVALHWMKMVC